MSFRRIASAVAALCVVAGLGIGIRNYQANNSYGESTEPSTSLSTSAPVDESSPSIATSSATEIRAYESGWRTVTVKATIDGSPHSGVDVDTQKLIEHCGKEPLADTVENRSKGEVWLTFDDFGSAEQVRAILDALKQKGVRGRFFLKKDWADNNPELLQQIAAEGHFIGNHTKSHQALLDVKSEHSGDTWQVRDQEESIIRNEISDGIQSTSLRPPYGAYDLRVMQILSTMSTDNGEKISICTWTNDSEDWNSKTTPDANAELERVKNGTTPNGVVLFHVHGRFTGQILPEYIDWLTANGYNLEKIS